MTDFPYLDLLKASGRIGQFFENLIIADFLKYSFIQPQRPRFFFWQKSAVSEGDLVISSRGQIIPVEIKYSSTFHDKMLGGIRAFRKDHETSGIFIPYSLVIYNGEFFCPEENIYCLPAWLFV